MICRKNSAVARQMMDFYTDQASVDAHRPHALHLMGVAAHVYCDTFAHYGFLGIDSHLNSVDLNSIQPDEAAHTEGLAAYLRQHVTDFLDRFELEIASLTPIGHGSVGTSPDQPYLRWRYTYIDREGNPGATVTRNNPADYLEACQALHQYFHQFANAYYGPTQCVPFTSIAPTLTKIIACHGIADQRIAEWMAAMHANQLGPATPPTKYDPERWINTMMNASKLVTDDGSDIAHAYNFFAAASYHQNYVLKRLLPEVGLYVV